MKLMDHSKLLQLWTHKVLHSNTLQDRATQWCQCLWKCLLLTDDGQSKLGFGYIKLLDPTAGFTAFLLCSSYNKLPRTVCQSYSIRLSKIPWASQKYWWVLRPGGSAQSGRSIIKLRLDSSKNIFYSSMTMYQPIASCQSNDTQPTQIKET